MARLKYTLIPILLFFLALSVRLYKIDQVTPGFLGDEIVIARDAEAIFSSPVYSPFTESNLGHPTALYYPIGLFINLFGRNLVALRLTSVLFASLTVPVFYLLLRRFWSLPAGILASLIFNFSYLHILTSRFANEVAPAGFFQVLSGLFLVLAVQKRSLFWLMSASVAIGLGLHTYLAFRGLAVGLFLIALVAYPVKKHLLASAVVILLIFSPLAIYGFRYPGSLWVRAKSISVFHQNLTPPQITAEMLATAKNIFLGFITGGDPDPRQNPARSPLFDPAAVMLMLAGILILLRDRHFFLLAAVAFLSVPILAGDIFTIEIIPDFRIPGQSHPNTFHLAGLIPIVYFLAAASVDRILKFSQKFNPHLVYSVTASVLAVIIFYNFGLYFNQQPHPFIYYFHNARQHQIVSYLNSLPSPVYISPALFRDEKIAYLTHPGKHVRLLTDTATAPAIIDLRSQSLMAETVIGRPEFPNTALILNPWNEPEALLVLP